MAIVAKMAELRQVVQQQEELIQKQAEDAKRREDELIFHHNEMFKVFMQRIPARQDENRAGLAAE